MKYKPEDYAEAENAKLRAVMEAARGIFLGEGEHLCSEFEDAMDALQQALAELDKEGEKGTYKCQNCQNLVESEYTNRLFCSYHSEGEYQHETFLDDYCNYFESKKEGER